MTNRDDLSSPGFVRPLADKKPVVKRIARNLWHKAVQARPGL